MTDMAPSKPIMFSDAKSCVDEIIRRVGKTIVFGMPLALGKSYHIINEIYRRAKDDPTMHLTFVSALALEKPGWSSDLERRMMQPIVDRIWEGVPDFDYMLDLRRDNLPPNVVVREFFCKAGGYINVPHAQQEYISSNYTHVVRDVVLSGINVYCHTVAKKETDGEIRYSDSCNADMCEIIECMDEIRSKGKPLIHVGHVNRSLPYMYGDAENPEDKYDIILEDESCHFPLFSVPKAAVTTPDYMIGMHVSALIKDGGTLQIGIGTLGDAIATGLILRQRENQVYRDFLKEARMDIRYGDLIGQEGGIEPFDKGLYGATEMLVEVFVKLYNEGIIKRQVYEHTQIQKMLNTGQLQEILTPESVETLLAEKPFSPVLTREDFGELQQFGVFREDLSYSDFQIKNGKSTWSADFRDPENRKRVASECMGEKLKNGVVLHGGFFIGSNGFYDELRNMDDGELRKFQMTGVHKVNQLYGDETLRALQRKDARFVNAGMKLSILGNVCSDGLEDGTVISGVGGQYNFVSMAHALPDARLIMMIRSTKQKGAQTLSNIVFNYGHTTVPRHLRDIVVTEYGIADLLGKSDKDVIAAILNITDSRFQKGLLDKAKQAGKIPENYEIPPEFRNNTPERLELILEPFRINGYFKPFPFGSEFTDQELVIGKALKQLKASITRNKLSTIRGLLGHMVKASPQQATPYLARLGLDVPASFKEKLMKKVVVYALQSSGAF